MPVETDAERRVLFADYGVAVSLLPPGGGTPITVGADGLPLRALVELGYVAGGQDGVLVSGTQPLCTMVAADAPPDLEGYRLEVDDVRYLVVEVMPDREGLLSLRLEEQTS